MSKILAIDTSNALCSAALSIDSRITLRFSDQERQHARRLLPMIAELLAEQNQQLTALDVIAIVSGPGSFTGLRIGAGVAQGLAFGSGVPVVGVSALEIIAMKAHRLYGESNLLVCMRARDDEVYSGAYCIRDRRAVLQRREIVGAPQDQHFSGIDNNIAWFGVGDGWCYVDELGAGGAFSFNGCNEAAIVTDAAMLSELAGLKWQQEGGSAPEFALPVYLKEQMDYQE